MVNGKIIFREAVIAGKEQQPALEILTVDGDNGVLNSSLIVPEHSKSGYELFMVYRSNGKSDIGHFKDPLDNPVTMGKSPLYTLSCKDMTYVKGLFALALLDHCFILRDLCGINVQAPDFTPRLKNDTVDGFLARSLIYF